LPDVAVPVTPEPYVPVMPGGTWERNCVHQAAAVFAAVLPVDPPDVGAAVGRILGRLGTRLSRPLMPVPALAAGVEETLGGVVTIGRLASTPWRAEPTPWAQVCAAAAAALASWVSVCSSAGLLAVMAARTSVWIVAVNWVAQLWIAPEIAFAAAVSRAVSVAVPFVPAAAAAPAAGGRAQPTDSWARAVARSARDSARAERGDQVRAAAGGIPPDPPR